MRHGLIFILVVLVSIFLLPATPVRPKPPSRPLPIRPILTRNAVVQYSKKYWYNYNLEDYKDYNPYGGDCANFVSQNLVAMGITLWRGYDGDGAGFHGEGTITYCDWLHLNLIKYQNVEWVQIHWPNTTIPDELTVGDVIIYGNDTDNWKHAVIVVYRNGDDVRIAAHNGDHFNISWDYIYDSSSFNIVNFYHFRNTKKTNYVIFRVTATALNVRSAPKVVTDNILGQIHQGEMYVAFENYTDANGRVWYHFWFDDRAAWCASWYTEPADPSYPVFMINVNSSSPLNVRDGPGTSYAVNDTVFDGQVFVASGEGTDANGRKWWRFWFGGDEKWVASWYTKVLKGRINFEESHGEAYTGDPVVLSVGIISDADVMNVSLEYWYEGGTHVEVPLEYNGTHWGALIELTSKPTMLYYRYIAIDANGDENSSETYSIVIKDNDPPVLLENNTPSVVRGKNSFELSLKFDDNDNVSYVEVWWYDGKVNHTMVVNTSMVLINISVNSSCTVIYGAIAYDASGNSVSVNGSTVVELQEGHPSIPGISYESQIGVIMVVVAVIAVLILLKRKKKSMDFYDEPYNL